MVPIMLNVRTAGRLAESLHRSMDRYPKGLAPAAPRIVRDAVWLGEAIAADMDIRNLLDGLDDATAAAKVHAAVRAHLLPSEKGKK